MVSLEGSLSDDVSSSLIHCEEQKDEADVY